MAFQVMSPAEKIVQGNLGNHRDRRTMEKVKRRLTSNVYQLQSLMQHKKRFCHKLQHSTTMRYHFTVDPVALQIIISALQSCILLRAINTDI